jgi:hypothetical protein
VTGVIVSTWRPGRLVCRFASIGRMGSRVFYWLHLQFVIDVATKVASVFQRRVGSHSYARLVYAKYGVISASRRLAISLLEVLLGLSWCSESASFYQSLVMWLPSAHERFIWNFESA